MRGNLLYRTLYDVNDGTEVPVGSRFVMTSCTERFATLLLLGRPGLAVVTVGLEELEQATL